MMETSKADSKSVEEKHFYKNLFASSTAGERKAKNKQVFDNITEHDKTIVPNNHKI